MKIDSLNLSYILLPKNDFCHLYCCTVHSEDSLIIKNQQMHYYRLCLFYLSVLMRVLE
jgi:hypothetical protein